MSIPKLQLNNGSGPEPSPTNYITLREYTGGPISQQEAEYNFINLTDRINDLITLTATHATSSALATTDSNVASNLSKIDQNTTNISTNISSINALQESVTSLDNLSWSNYQRITTAEGTIDTHQTKLVDVDRVIGSLTTMINEVEADVEKNREDIDKNTVAVPESLVADGLFISSEGGIYQTASKPFYIGCGSNPLNIKDASFIRGSGVATEGDYSGYTSITMGSADASGETPMLLNVRGVVYADEVISRAGGRLEIADLVARIKNLEDAKKGWTFLANQVRVNHNQDGNKIIDLRNYVPEGATTALFSMRQPSLETPSPVHTPTMEVTFYNNTSFSGEGHKVLLQVNDRGIQAGEQFIAPMINDRRVYMKVAGDTWSTRTTHEINFHGYQ